MTPFLYNNTLNNTNPMLYSLHRAGDSIHKSGFYFKRDNNYPYSSIHYISKGSLFYIYKSKKYLLKAGDMFLFDSYNNHEYGIMNHCPALTISFIEFNSGDSHPIMQSVLNSISPIISPNDNTQIVDNMRNIFNYINKDEIDVYSISQTIYEILVHLMKLNDYSTQESLLSPDLFKLRNALNYIDSNIGSTLSIEVLANISSYSPTYFAKLFSKATGTTPAKYIVTKRITLAKELLSSPTKKVEEIAFMLGFCNPSHFIRTFKKYEGLTPSQYRTQSLIYSS